MSSQKVFKVMTESPCVTVARGYSLCEAMHEFDGTVTSLIIHPSLAHRNGLVAFFCGHHKRWIPVDGCNEAIKKAVEGFSDARYGPR